MSLSQKRSCIACRGERQVGEIRERIWEEPEDAEAKNSVLLQGYICEECATIHWAWSVQAVGVLPMRLDDGSTIECVSISGGADSTNGEPNSLTLDVRGKLVRYWRETGDASSEAEAGS